MSAALQRVRDSGSDEVDPAATLVLEKAVNDIWKKVQAKPNSYIMSKEEFAVFNYYQSKFEGSEVAQRAISRFWTNHKGDASTLDQYDSDQ
ncbi:hypothetical protein MMC25_002034 [Agyrium rufum]|nr:hypothetical protein [Agyrium rufum]